MYNICIVYICIYVLSCDNNNNNKRIEESAVFASRLYSMQFVYTEQPSGKSTVNRLLKMRFPFYVLCYVVSIGYTGIYIVGPSHMCDAMKCRCFVYSIVSYRVYVGMGLYLKGKCNSSNITLLLSVVYNKNIHTIKYIYTMRWSTKCLGSSSSLRNSSSHNSEATSCIYVYFPHRISFLCTIHLPR